LRSRNAGPGSSVTVRASIFAAVLAGQARLGNLAAGVMA
jgi:hypothetical protein